jgi:hypothetical protein
MNASELWVNRIPWLDTIPEDETKRAIIINYVNEQLSKSEWTQLPDAMLMATERIAWQTYREGLQDIPFLQTSPDLIVIPDAPLPRIAPPLAATRTRWRTARITAKSIPNWATWTQGEWQTYFDANLSDAEIDKVTSLAAARVALKRMNTIIDKLAKLELALRDEAWPELPDE